VIEGWRKLHNEEFLLFAKYNCSDPVKEDRIGRACSTYGGEKEWVRILVRNPEGKKPLGRVRRKWNDNRS
jgi:hypothetical protein